MLFNFQGPVLSETAYSFQHIRFFLSTPFLRFLKSFFRGLPCFWLCHALCACPQPRVFLPVFRVLDYNITYFPFCQHPFQIFSIFPLFFVPLSRVRQKIVFLKLFFNFSLVVFISVFCLQISFTITQTLIFSIFHNESSQKYYCICRTLNI